MTLPAAVRERVLALAAQRLGALPADQVPAGLKRYRDFTPAKRARLAAVPLAAALESDPAFRQEVASLVDPALASALAEGTDLPAVAPAEAAAAGYLLRTTGWEALVAAAAAAEAARPDVAPDVVARLTEQLEETRSAARAEATRLRAEADEVRAELVAVRKKVRQQGEAVAAARRAEEAARREVAAASADAAAAVAASDVELRRLRQRVDEAERVAAGARQAAREGRNADELRLRLLLDALLGAAQGLRRELALAPAEGRPGDAVAADYARAAAGPTAQGRADDDPGLLDALLAVPLTHLLVDGYNVTKTGYGGLALEAQRSRLLSGLGALAARTGAEVTVVFDGADRVGPAVAAPRGVRCLFSRAGETAVEVLRRMVRAEPEGRPLVVVSSDREVADGVRASGARAIASVALVKLLDR